MTSLSWPDPLFTPVRTFTIILIDDDNDDIDDNDDNSDATRPQLLFFLCFRNQKYVTADFEFEVFKPSVMHTTLESKTESPGDTIIDEFVMFSSN